MSIELFQYDDIKRWSVKAIWENNWSFTGIVSDFFDGFQSDDDVKRWIESKHNCPLNYLEIKRVL
ncbi:hypothetical protein ACFWGC_26960 [Cytobacillus pseudoceanisediminis]|uniref:hypothetical protein n=1 Tax=Cytobacillus pseudoceanisediminis TaxID=3051614 RepID=UPI003648C5D2